MSGDPNDLFIRMAAALDADAPLPPGQSGPQATPGIGTVSTGRSRAVVDTARRVAAPASLQRSPRQVASALRRAIAGN